MALRIIACGGRDHTDANRICDVLDELHARRPVGMLFYATLAEPTAWVARGAL